ncbi:MAG: hypothetical protein IT385_13560 [Deltaproteobacteria bacterium]|nr:hypothetical protein [Deltaproteobacteria bacterium]
MTRAAGCVVELFELDQLPPDFRARVEREGVELHPSGPPGSPGQAGDP